MDIGSAVEALRGGSIVTRAAWNSAAMLSLENGMLIYTDGYGSVGFMADTADLLADDWELM